MHCRRARRETITDLCSSVFQLGFKKYGSIVAVDDRSIIDGALSGGPAGLVYGFIIVWAGTSAVFTSLSELASMYALC